MSRKIGDPCPKFTVVANGHIFNKGSNYVPVLQYTSRSPFKELLPRCPFKYKHRTIYTYTLSSRNLRFLIIIIFPPTNLYRARHTAPPPTHWLLLWKKPVSPVPISLVEHTHYNCTHERKKNRYADQCTQ